ncbi:MAG TPA: tetratricopeptide repeat protein [Candidatus Methylacidiphilales bacterium]|nr:tetratricopeptide repeat protein [Candidatus Methylacidiphilales bacterium]
MAKRFTKKNAATVHASTPHAAKKMESDPMPVLRPNRDVFGESVLVLAIILAYTPVWRAGYIWDDNTFITANPCIVGPLGLKEIWTTRAADICPLTLTVVWLEHALWGLTALPYHLVNVLLHAACAVLLWQVLRSLHVAGAWLGAALWALHPVQVQSVAWITEIKNTQSALFFLLSILFFVKWLKTEKSRGGDRLYGLTLLFAVLAMASKSSTVILPVILCLCAWWVEGRWNWRHATRLIPLFVISLADGMWTVWNQKFYAGAIGPEWEQTWPERSVIAGKIIWFYLSKLVWPHPLIPIYPRWKIEPSQWTAYVPLAAATLALLFLWRYRNQALRPAFFAFACFLAALFPVLGFFNDYFFRYSFVSDHFQYLAGMGPLALAGAGLTQISNRVIPGKRWLQSIPGGGLLVILGILSWQRAWAYQNAETFWTRMLAQDPDSWVAYDNIGNLLLKKGQMDTAIGEFETALAIQPNYTDTHNNLGNGLLQKGQVDGAIEQFQEALKINPNDVKTHNNLGNALAQKGLTGEAIIHYQQALQSNPDSAEIGNNLGLALSQEGRLDEAIAAYQQALQTNPDFPEAHYNLGNALSQKGELDEAIAHYQKAVQIDPDYTKACNSLGLALARKGDVNGAIEQLQIALEITPNDASLHDNLGWFLLQKGDLGGAIEQYQKAIRFNPGDANTYNGLGIALFRQGQSAKAISAFQKAVQLNPNYTDAHNNLIKLDTLARQKSENK